MTTKAEQVQGIKVCAGCKLEKHLVEFSKKKTTKDGFQSCCKNCMSSQWKAYQAKNRKILSEKTAKWRENNSEHVESYAKEYRELNKDRLLAKGAEYRVKNISYFRNHSRNRYLQIKQDPEKYSEHLKRAGVSNLKSKLRHPDRNRARGAVAYAVKMGVLARPESCPECGFVGKIEAHHDSYEKDRWLDVLWLCRNCHSKRHQKYPDLFR
jgi:hypothetical protein